MAVAPIPSDPRTWDDFSDPESRGFTDASNLSKKLDCAWFDMPDDSRLIVKRGASGVEVRFGAAVAILWK